jgi:nucleotide-binding universal stress UspA family protein
MKTSNTKRKIAETVMGAAVGAAIAGPVGAVAGGLAGSQASAHTAHAEGDEAARDAGDPIIHAQLKRILVPIDFSQPSRRALRFAREWAARFGAEVCLLHVIEPIATVSAFGVGPVAPPLPPLDYHDQAREELGKLVHQEFPDSANVSVHLRDGIPFDEIANAARDLNADIIILATHGRTGLAHVLLGSTAERVVRHSLVPVLTLRRAP